MQASGSIRAMVLPSEIEILPMHEVGHRAALEILDGAIALPVHPVAQSVDHVIDDAEAVMHRGGADLHRARAAGR